MGWDEWDTWRAQTKANHPIQYRVREFATWLSHRFWDWVDWPVAMWRWAFKPPHKLVRAAIPRTWSDLTGLIVDINFAIILQFKEEMDIVDWDATEEHAAFRDWHTNAVKYIRTNRPDLESKKDDIIHIGGSETWYKAYQDIEDEIEKRDTELLKQMIENRGYFWT